MSARFRPSLRRWRVLALAGVSLVTLGVVAGVADAATSAGSASASSTVHVCVARSTGAVRIVATGRSCRRTESATSWNRVGPRGAVGPRGSTGARGAAAPDPAPRAVVVGTVTLKPPTGATSINFSITSFSATQSVPPAAGGGAGSGKVTFQPFSISKKIDASSPTLFAALTGGSIFPSGEVQLLGPDGKVAETYGLKSVQVTAMTTASTGAATDPAHEDLTLQVGGLEVAAG